ncbi:hypothetical protein OSB04_027859 [Centaurea solstitialis]|uniref:Uncharacterized protein n=1 Tax=Centaurea solstitialis TaxID=347529 RepID=A0AA38SM24_9ASTR|nr:hypothetical protein OSB04_027859 [Centaurea solstitialis]
MLFYLTTFRVSNTLTKDELSLEPPINQDRSIHSQIQVVAHQKAIEAWQTNEYSCQNYILNALNDSLHDIYSTFGTTREGSFSKHKFHNFKGKNVVRSWVMEPRTVDIDVSMEMLEEMAVDGGSNFHANLAYSPNEFIRDVEAHMVTNVIDWRSTPRQPVTYAIQGRCLKLINRGTDVHGKCIYHNDLRKGVEWVQIVFGSEKFVIKKATYIGKGYVDEGLFKLSINNSINITNACNVYNKNKAGTSTTSMYIVDHTFLCIRLGHCSPLKSVSNRFTWVCPDYILVRISGFRVAVLRLKRSSGFGRLVWVGQDLIFAFILVIDVTTILGGYLASFVMREKKRIFAKDNYETNYGN